ncbi:MAG: DUF1858 domain-containing protein [Chloroflexota bacterium]
MKQSRQRRQQTDRTLSSVAIAGQTVADVLSCWPQTVPVFIHYRLACVGCSLSRFELIADVAAIYGINPDGFLQDLRQAIDGSDSNSSPMDCEEERDEG